MMAPDPLSAKFSALADPTRRALLARLAEGPATVAELAAPFEISLPAISRHLQVLERSGLIGRSREAQRRPAALQPLAMKEIDDWIERYRRFWDGSFDRLADYLASVQPGGDDGDRN